MTDLPNTHDHAAQRLVEARARFQATLGVAKHELAPKTLFTRKARQMRDRAETEVRARPYATAGTATALFLFLFRKPIAGLVRRLLREKRYD